jgi:hypothetical protein
LEEIAGASDRYYWSIMEALTVYVRVNSPWPPVPKQVQANQTASHGKDDGPGEEIQSVLNVLGYRRGTFGDRLERLPGSRRLDWRATDSQTEQGRVLRLSRTDLRKILLRDAHLEQARLRRANLSGAHLDRAKLMGARLRKAILKKAKLIDADLRGAHLQKADLQGADLTRANLIGARLYGANFRGAEHVDSVIVDCILIEVRDGGEKRKKRLHGEEARAWVREQAGLSRSADQHK